MAIVAVVVVVVAMLVGCEEFFPYLFQSGQFRDAESSGRLMGGAVEAAVASRRRRHQTLSTFAATDLVTRLRQQ